MLGVTEYNPIGTIGAAPDPDNAEDWIDALLRYSPAVGFVHSSAEIVITVPARSLADAATAGLAGLERAVGPLARLEILTTLEFDQRADREAPAG